MHTSEERARQLKFNNVKSTLRKFEALLEIFVFIAMFYWTWVWFYREHMHPYYGYGKFVLLGIYFILMLVILKLSDGFQFGHFKLSDVFASQFISLLVVNFITYFQLCLMANVMLNVLPMLSLFIAEVLVALLCSFIFTGIYHQFNVPQNMLMIYENENAVTLKFKMDTRQDKYVVTEVAHISEGHDTIHQKILNHDSVILNDIHSELRNDILKSCYANGIRTYIVPKIPDIITRGAAPITLFDTPLLLVRGRGLSPMQNFTKRALDLFLAILVMIPFLPILAIVSLAIKIEDHGPIFYTQKRITRGGKEFNIIKFRSMIVDAEKGGYNMETMRATGKDPRITKVGNIIRKCRIDELPQILNILKGDMSWVGPRPERVENYEEYCKDMPEFELRNKVKGGLTGYAQIYGKYNTYAYDKLRLDLMYIEDYSIYLDIKLIFMTLQIMFKPEATEGFDKAKELEQRKRELLKSKEA